MRWASFVSEEPELGIAARQAAAEIERQLGPSAADLILVFASAHHAADYARIPATIAERIPGVPVLGCSGGGVVGGGREIEHSPALSLTAASLPGVRLQSFYLDGAQSDWLVSEPSAWAEVLDSRAEEVSGFVLMADPFSCDARGLLQSLDASYGGARKIGGLASGAGHPGDNALFHDESAHTEGVVGLVLEGDVDIDTIVAQGCRPIGPPLFVTSAVRNRILELDGRRPTDVLADVYETLPTEDRKLFRHSLFMGFVMAEGRSEYVHGDFLVRNIVGVDPDSGTVAVGEMVSPGQVVQLHLRDASTSAHDLDTLLREYKTRGGGAPDGALLFSCLGRGETLYGERDHDSRMIEQHLGPLPIGGFFCNGEIGPVNERTFLHGYTSSIALFRRRGRDAR